MRPDPLNRPPAPSAARLLVALLVLLACEPLAAQVFLPARRIAPSLSTSSLNPTNGLVAYWKMEEASGATRVDSFWTNNLSKINDTVGQAAGIILNAADFSSFGELAHTPTASTNFVFRTWSFTIAGWVRLDSKATSRAIANRDSNGGREYTLYYSLSANRFRLQVTTNATDNAAVISVDANTLGSPSTATWYYIAAGRDTNNGTLFISVNGGAKDTSAFVGWDVAKQNVELEVGAHSSNAAAGGDTAPNYMDGRIDELGIWKGYALTDAEISFLYNGGTGKTLTGGVFVDP